MPAVVRGGRRQASTSRAAPKKAASGGRRKGSSPPRKLDALGALGLSERWIFGAVLGLLLLGTVLVLATHGRAQALASAASEALDHRLAAMGFKLERVHLQGVSPEARPAIEAALDLHKDQPLARMDLNALRQRVEQVGWVKSARIVRLLPNTLVVAVEERERLAVWEHDGRAVVIDPEGRPIKEADPTRFADLPLVVGAGADQAAGRILPLLHQRPRLAARLEALVRVDDRRWDLRLKDGSLVQLPAGDEEGALMQFDQLDQKARVLDLGFKRIDLRDPEMAAVRLNDGSAPAAPSAGG